MFPALTQALVSQESVAAPTERLFVCLALHALINVLDVLEAVSAAINNVRFASKIAAASAGLTIGSVIQSSAVVAVFRRFSIL